MRHTVSFNNEDISVSKIICLGRNYQKHIEEMHSRPIKDPVIFLKPATALITEKAVEIPTSVGSIHYEVELVALIGRDGKNVPKEKAMDYIQGYGVGLDLTLRDVQSVAKQNGLPWAIAKGFDNSAPVGPFISALEVPNVYDLNIALYQNGVLRQNSNTSYMIYKLDFLLSYISRFITLEAGDLFFTGTPEGVGPINPGDVLKGNIDHLLPLEIKIKETGH